MTAIYKYAASIAFATASVNIGIATPALSFSFNLPSGFNSDLAEQNPTSLYFFSEPGDFVGQGQEWFYALPDGNFNISRNFDNGIDFRFSNFGLVDFSESISWNVSFAAPFEQTLVPGLYDGATRFPFQDASNPGLSASGDGRGCNRSGGRFEVVEAQYDSNGNIENFDAFFAQFCENESAMGTPALFGRVRYNASSSVPEPSSGVAILIGFGTLTLWKRLRCSNKYIDASSR